MAVLTKTISNSINVFGLEETSKYGVAVYGADTYGTGGIDLPLVVIKAIQNTLNAATAQQKLFIKYYTNAVSLTDTVSKTEYRTTSNNISVTNELTDIYKKVGDWYYVWPTGVTNFVDRSVASWSESSISETVWVASATTTTTWVIS